MNNCSRDRFSLPNEMKSMRLLFLFLKSASAFAMILYKEKLPKKPESLILGRCSKTQKIFKDLRTDGNII